MELEGKNALCVHLHAFGCHSNTFHVVMFKIFTVPPRRYHDDSSRAAAKMMLNTIRIRSQHCHFHFMTMRLSIGGFFPWRRSYCIADAVLASRSLIRLGGSRRALVGRSNEGASARWCVCTRKRKTMNGLGPARLDATFQTWGSHNGLHG